MSPSAALSLWECFLQVAASELPASGSFRGHLLLGNRGVWICCDGLGRPVLLISQNSSSSAPLRLRNLEITYSVMARVTDGTFEHEDTFAVIACLSSDDGLVALFWSVCESLIDLLPPAPTATQIDTLASGLIDLFSRLSRRPSGSLIGLAGELIFILAAAKSTAAVSAWREEPSEGWDFVFPNCRIDAKATTSSVRIHELSYVQGNAAGQPDAYLVSILIREAAGGISIVELMRLVVHAVADDAILVAKVHRVVADTLGSELLFPNFRIDLAPTLASVLVFQADGVPAIRTPIPGGVSRIRFASDFSVGEEGAAISSLGI